MERQHAAPLLVENVVERTEHRVLADTPLSEVVDYMVRQAARAVPVVGEHLEVLGIITTGDALGHVLRERPGDDAPPVEEDEGPTMARDVMTRAVLCVTESQPLVDAARMMVNRKIEQLPVVRDGELVGLVTREAALQALHGAPGDTHSKHEGLDP